MTGEILTGLLMGFTLTASAAIPLLMYMARRRADTAVRAYRIGLRHGMACYQQAFLADQYRLATAEYPADGNIISINRHRAYLPSEPAA